MQKQLSEKQKKILYICSILVFIGLILFLFFVVGKPLVQYATNPAQFKSWIDSFGIFSRLIFIAIVMLQVVVAIIPGEPFEIAAGYCFGAIEGTLLALLGITLGCLVIFLLVKRYQESIIQVFFKEKDYRKFEFLKDPVKAKSLVFLLNIIPGIPKDALSYFIGLTPIDMKSWLLIVFIGRIPSVITSTLAGYYLLIQKYNSTVIVFIITFAISAIGVVIYNIIMKKQGQKQNEK